jgi:excisionase family DNA binding protein
MTTHAQHDAEQDAVHDAEREGTWATLAEAASLLGCSVDTVRRRIRRGELHALQDAGRHGPTWRVLLSATPGTLPTVGSTPSTTPSVGEESSALLEALRMLDAMRQENRDLAGQVGYLQARVQMQEETIRALQAPQVAYESAGASNSTAGRTPPEPQPAPEPFPAPIPPTPKAAPWWRRWVPWLAGAGMALAVASASCQATGSVKHAALCTSSRAGIDLMATMLGSRGVPANDVWEMTTDIIAVAEKVC